MAYSCIKISTNCAFKLVQYGQNVMNVYTDKRGIKTLVNLTIINDLKSIYNAISLYF